MIGKKDKYLIAAQKLIERGQLDKALLELAKVVEEDPRDTRTWLKMAELHARRGSNAEATEIYLRTGELYAEQGFVQKAVAVYKNVLKLSPGTVIAHLKLAELFKQIGLGVDAVHQLEQAAASLQRAGKELDAVAALRGALEIQPDNVSLRVKLAEGASRAGLTEEAVREFGLAAEQLKARGRADESLRVVERILFHQPDNRVIARELAEAYIAKGNPRLALPKLQACLKSDPRDPHTLALLARALEQLGQVPKAVSVLRELVFLCDDLGRTNERDAALLRGLTLDPNDAELREAAARHQLRGATGAESEATPPPTRRRDAAGVERGGSFDLSGSGRSPAGGLSGRVVAAPGERGTGTGTGTSASASLAGGIDLASGPSAAMDVGRTLAEAEVFVKYGLLERAADHLRRVFETEPNHREARERLIAVVRRLGRPEEAAFELETLAESLSSSDPWTARRLADEALALDPSAVKARALSVSLANAAPAERVPDAPAAGEGEPVTSAKTPRLIETPPAGVAVRPEPEPGSEPESEPAAADPALASSSTTGEPPAVVGGGEMAVPGTVPRFDASATPPQGFRLSLDAVDGDLAASGVPRSLETEHTPRIEEDGPDWNSPAVADDDEERVAHAFSDHAATIAGAVEGLAELERFVDDEELAAALDQVSFFVEQRMSEAAGALLQDLVLRFPGHPLVAEKLSELRALLSPRDALAVAALGSLGDAMPGAIPDQPAVNATVIEGLSPADATPRPSGVEPGQGGSDFAGHAELGGAYKSMGLYDAAIAEMKLLARDPDREVFALTAMGECFEAKGSFTEAIIRYKRALNCDQVTPEETRALYFLLGGAFERLGDVSEALYFLEKVAKRDPRFRDVDQKIAALRPRLVKRAR